jgi:enolase
LLNLTENRIKMVDTTIAKIEARQILDSRGRPTVEVDVVLADGAVGRAAVPSGASTGRNEVHELRDGDVGWYAGQGVRRAVANVQTTLGPAIIGRRAEDQRPIDELLRELDGTPDLSALGANAVLGISLALCRASAAAMGQPLYRRIADLAGSVRPAMPCPMVNILSGGLHAGRGMDLQDFLAIPVSARNYSEALHMMVKLRAAASVVATRRGLPVLLADEGGLSPGLASVEAALDLMMESIDEAGFVAGREIAIALDVAASELFAATRCYELRREGRSLSAGELVDAIAGWAARYPIVSIEDGLHDEDWEHWPELTRRLPNVQIIGDDLFSTDPRRILRGIGVRAANAALIKVNQNGTLSGTLDAMAAARSGGYATVVSARSGETEDSFIADLAVGTAAGQIKIGSLRSSERLSKYNQLLRIEAESGAPFAGFAVPAPRPAVSAA